MRWAGLTFRCSSCGAVFADADALRRHARRHTREGGRAPRVAARLTDVELYLRAGELRGGRESPTFVCSLCGAGYGTPGGLRRHVARHVACGAPAASLGPSMPPPAAASLGPSMPPPAASTVPPAPAVSREGLRSAREEFSTPASEPAHTTRGRRRLERRARRRRERARASVLLAATALLLLLSTASALAWFTGSSSGSATITTGRWVDCLSFAPGDSRAIHWSESALTTQQPIALEGEDGGLALDLGDALGGTHRSWVDVLRVSSSAADPLRLAFAADGAVAPFVTRVSLSRGASRDLLEPGQTRSIALRLVVADDAAPGVYDGVVTVAVAGGSERHEFPVRLDVLSAVPQPGVSPSCPPGVAPDSEEPTPAPEPTEGPSPSPAPEPDPSVSPEPDPSASPSPAPDPSASPSPAPDPSPDPSPSPSPSSSGEPEPGPVPGELVSLAPGSASVVRGLNPGTPPVATARPDGSLSLDFGRVPAGETFAFDDVVRVCCDAGREVTVRLAATGAVAPFIQEVGFCSGAGSVSSVLTLGAGERAEVRFVLDPPAETSCGPYRGALSVVAEVDGAAAQRLDVPIEVTIAASASDGDSGDSGEAVEGAAPFDFLSWLRALLGLARYRLDTPGGRYVDVPGGRQVDLSASRRAPLTLIADARR